MSPDALHPPIHLKDPALLRTKCYLDGGWHGADDGRTREVVDPATHRKIGTVPVLGATETRRAIEAARHPDDLADPFIQLSMSAFLGFQFPSPVAMVLDQLLMHAQELTLVMSLEERELH